MLCARVLFRTWLTGALAGLALFGMAGNAKATLITWIDEPFTCISNCADNTGFDSGYITFTPFFSDSLDDISGGGTVHVHSDSMTFFLDIRLNGIWVNIFEGFATRVDTILQSISTPIAFTPGMVLILPQ